MTAATARRMKPLVEPVHLVAYFSEEPNDAMAALGLRTSWDGYFAGRAAPLGLAPAEVVHAVFYNFADGEVARHLPAVWRTTTPAAAHAARQAGCVTALRRLLGGLADDPSVDRAAELALVAARAAPPEGRPLFAGLRALPEPTEPLERLWHAATLLREHRGDGHVAALVAAGIGGLESHVLQALDLGLRAERFGRIHHLPRAQVDAVVDGLRARGLVDADGGFTPAGRAVRARIEEHTDELAAPPYDALTAEELDELESCLVPIAAALAVEVRG